MFRRYMYKVTPILPKRPSCSGRRENKFRERILIVFPVVCLPCKSKLEILLFVSSRPQLGASNGGPRPLHLTVVVPLRKPSQRRPAHSHARKSGLAKTSIFLSLLFFVNTLIDEETVLFRSSHHSCFGHLKDFLSSHGALQWPSTLPCALLPEFER